MSANHTPGPWDAWLGASKFGITGPAAAAAGIAIMEIRRSGFVSADIVVQIAAENKTAPALALGDTREEAEANASLIAAAPELLEACKTFAEWLRREEEGFPNAGEVRRTQEGEARWRSWYNENLAICNLAQEQALAAIAKATEVRS